MKKFHPELSKKIGLDSTEKQVEIIRRFDAEKRERKEDLYAWFYNRYICPDSRMYKLVIARTELAGKITKGELKLHTKTFSKTKSQSPRRRRTMIHYTGSLGIMNIEPREKNIIDFVDGLTNWNRRSTRPRFSTQSAEMFARK